MATTSGKDLEARLVAAEEALAHQTRVSDELSAMVTKQWERLDRMERQLSHLTGQMEDLADNLPAPPANQKPPHW